MLDIYRQNGDTSAENLISGFYYDEQLLNPLNHITLHCNTYCHETAQPIYDLKKNVEIVKKAMDNTEGFVNKMEAAWNATKEDANATRVYKTTEWLTFDTDGKNTYLDLPLCTSILTDDFSVAIQNNWSDFGGNVLGEIWNNNVKPYSPYLSEVKAGIHKMREEQEGEGEEGMLGSGILKKGVEFLDDMFTKYGGQLQKHFNSALIMQGTRFAFYAGSGVAFSNLGMKFTVFPKFNSDGTAVTVTKQVDLLYPYFMGKYEESQLIKGTALEGFVAWQVPPAGFESGIKDINSSSGDGPYPIDNILKGTLELRIGAQYRINNLVSEGAIFNYSKQMVKLKDSNGDITISPLYCDVSVNLKPVTKYSDSALRKFAIGYSEENNKADSGIAHDLNNNLDKLETKYQETYVQKTE